MSLWLRVLLGSLLASTGITMVLSLTPIDLPWWVWYLLSINVVTLGLYGYDKLIAGGAATRIPELSLQALVLLGGSVGALVGIFGFHHKTRKAWFLLGVFALLILQLLTIAWVLGVFDQQV